MLLRRVNNNIFKVNFKNLFFILLWVLVCLNVGNNHGELSIKLTTSVGSPRITSLLIKRVLCVKKGYLSGITLFFWVFPHAGHQQQQKKASKFSFNNFLICSSTQRNRRHPGVNFINSKCRHLKCQIMAFNF